MTSQQILQSDMLDILFENRNKAYGAYSLRKMYRHQLLKAIGLTSLLIFALLFFGNRSSEKAVTETTKKDYVLTEVAMPEVKKIEPLKPKVSAPAPAAPVKQVQLTDDVKIVDVTKNTVASQDDLKDAIVGSSTIQGPPSTGIPVPPTPNPGNGTSETEAPPAPKEDASLPSRSPQFPGGTAAWLAFLNRHLRPPADLEAGEKRSTAIRFSVDEEGTITNFQIIQSGGADFDNEVIRVLKKMPKWLPALQSGKPIAVSFTQPVTFVAPEE